jgi:hypothetical protein
MEKYLKYVPAFVFGILFLLVYKFGIAGLVSNELSYKMTGVQPRYVDKFRYTPVYVADRITGPQYSAPGAEYFKKLNGMKENIEKIFPSDTVSEIIVIYIADLGNYPITATVRKSKVEFVDGIVANTIPTAIFKVKKADIDGLEKMVSDGKVDTQEKIRIADVIAGPMIERMYRLSRLYKVEHLANFGFDDFMQLEIQGGEGIDRAGTPVELKYSIVNVDGQWMVTKGFTGDPDVRFSLTMDQTLSLYTNMVINLENSKDKIEALKYSKEGFGILKDNISYVRDDHR